MADIWAMGYNFIEPFEPPPRGNVSIGEALAAAKGRGIVFGGIDDVLLVTVSKEATCKAGGFGLPLKGAESLLLLLLRPLLPLPPSSSQYYTL